MNKSVMTTWQHNGILAKDREQFLADLQALAGIVAPTVDGQTSAQIQTAIQAEVDTILAAATTRIQAEIDAA